MCLSSGNALFGFEAINFFSFIFHDHELGFMYIFVVKILWMWRLLVPYTFTFKLLFSLMVFFFFYHTLLSFHVDLSYFLFCRDPSLPWVKAAIL